MAAAAEGLRLATFDAGLSRQGPGLLLRDILKADDPQVTAVRAMIAALDADVLLVTGMDYDAGLLAARALVGDDYPHIFALRPNTGWQTGLDLDGDGKRGHAGDAQGWGRFSGQAGLALFSRLPLGVARDFSGFLWRDLPGANLPPTSAEALEIQRLSTTAHWDVPVLLPGGGNLHLLLWSATPPAFDGPEDRNGRRGGDESLFWQLLLDRRLTIPPPDPPFVLMGKANIDPVAGDGLHTAVRMLLAHPAVQDPEPQGAEGTATADFRARDGPGLLRVDYVLPSAELRVTAAGVLWPSPDDPLAAVAMAASRHRPVWVDIALP